jgi:hypothetical protein
LKAETPLSAEIDGTGLSDIVHEVDEGESTDKAAIIGVTVGAVLLTALVVAIIVWAFLRRKKTENTP